MAVDLSNRAVTQLASLRTRVDAAGAELAAARDDRDRRHADPASVDRDDWAADLGAVQHVATARAALSAVRDEQERVRAALAAVDNPADAATHEAALRAALVEDAQLRVELRSAEERLAGVDERIAALSAAVATGLGAVADAQARLEPAARRQAAGEALRAALGGAPLDTVVADATALRASPEFDAADDRLDALVPADLRARAEVRATEAGALADDADAHWAAGDVVRVDAAAAGAPLVAGVAAAEQAFVLAEAALRRYVGGAAAELAAAGDTLATVAGLPDLTVAQVAALDPAGHADAVPAATAEGALATAVADVAAARRALDDAILAALAGDPDADPEDDPAVVAARAALEDPALQDALSDARAGYDEAARAALDAWEVEMPPDLWAGLAAFDQARRTLDRLADQARRDALVTALDDAQDTLAAALDARDEQVRRELAVAVETAARRGARVAASARGTDRFTQYLRGDGPGGRSAEQL